MKKICLIVFRIIEILIAIIIVICLLPVKFAVPIESTINKHLSLERYVVSFNDGVYIINSNYDKYNSRYNKEIYYFNELSGKKFYDHLPKTIVGVIYNHGDGYVGSDFVIYGKKYYSDDKVCFDVRHWDILQPIKRNKIIFSNIFSNISYITIWDYIEDIVIDIIMQT